MCGGVRLKLPGPFSKEKGAAGSTSLRDTGRAWGWKKQRLDDKRFVATCE